MDAEKDILQDTYHTIGSKYAVMRDGTACEIVRKVTDDATAVDIYLEPIANHTPLLTEQVIIDNGFEVTEQLVFNVRRDFKQWGDTPVTLRDVLGLTPNLAFGAACRIFLLPRAKARYSELLQMQCEHAPTKTIYQKTGYKAIGGELVFLNGGCSVTKDGLTDKHIVQLEGQLNNYGFTPEREPERFNTLLRVLPAVAPQPLIFAGLGLAFLTPLNMMLRQEGIEPSFILYFTGKTGTRKTTLAKLFLNFFGSFDNGTSPPASFRDTVNAMEKKLALADSVVILLDDRIPSTTAKIRARMEEMEQTAARLIGDRSPRGRMNADGTLRVSYRPNANLIITAEESYFNVGESGVARSISVELKPGDADLQALTKAQQNAAHLNECMSEYIQWVLGNWDSLRNRLKPMFHALREKAQTGGHGRLAESVAHLQMGISTMCEWLVSVGEIDALASTALCEKSWGIFIALAEEQNRRISEEKPVKLFLDAVKELLDRGTVRVLSTKSPLSGAPLATIGYRDESFYYLFPDSVYSEVKVSNPGMAIESDEPSITSISPPGCPFTTCSAPLLAAEGAPLFPIPYPTPSATRATRATETGRMFFLNLSSKGYSPFMSV